MKDENCDVIGEKCIKDSNGTIAYTDTDKLAVWKEHYSKLLNVEFPWDSEALPQTHPVSGPPPHISEELVRFAMGKLKAGKAAGPSGVIAEMFRSYTPALISSFARLTTDIIREGKIPVEWDLSYIINCYKGKGDAMTCGNYRGLKLLDQGLKVVERIVEGFLRSHVDIDSMQFGFMPGRGTTDPIFIMRQLHEKYLGKGKDLYFMFIDLEKAFDRVPRKVLWWALRKLLVPEWLVRTIQAMYSGAKSAIRINGQFSAEFGVTVGVHQGSVLSPLLFIIVMEALSQEFRTGCPWEILYADDLVLVAESVEELTRKFSLWKQSLEGKGLRVNLGKTKVMVSLGGRARKLHQSGKHPCGICFKGVGSNSIYCGQCKHWIHHRPCSGIKGRLKPNPDYVCRRCLRELPPSPVEQPVEFYFEGAHIETVSDFCYLGDVTGNTGGCVDAVTARIKSAWKSFRELLPLLTNRAISPRHRGDVFSACVRAVLLHASETWPVTVEDQRRLYNTDNAMVRWMCGKKISDRVRLSSMHQEIGISSLETCLRIRRLRWFGHIERQPANAWPNAVRHLVVPGTAPRGRPKKRWKDCVNDDLRALKLKKEDAMERDKWRSLIRKPSRPKASNPQG